MYELDNQTHKPESKYYSIIVNSPLDMTNALSVGDYCALFL